MEENHLFQQHKDVNGLKASLHDATPWPESLSSHSSLQPGTEAPEKLPDVAVRFVEAHRCTAGIGTCHGVLQAHLLSKTSLTA